MNQLTPINNIIPVISSCIVEGETIVEVNCNDFSEFKKLPEAVNFSGEMLVKTGWNSDKFRAYYKSAKNFQFATAV